MSEQQEKSNEVTQDVAVPLSATSKKRKAKKEKTRRKSQGDAVDTVNDGGEAKRMKAHSDAVSPAPDSSGKKKKEKKKKEKKKDKQKDDATKALESSSPTPADPGNNVNVSQILSQKPVLQSTTPNSIFSLVSSTPATSTTATRQLQKSPFQIKNLLGCVALLPTSLHNVPQCIRSLLHSLLLMYDANMGGVLLSLEENVTLLPLDAAAVTDDEGSNSRNGYGGSGLIGGRIVDDLPYIHYKFQTRGLLFCPSVGMKLKGQVIECTPTFITLTTNHILSTKISTENLHRQGFFYNSTTLEWTRERDSTNNNQENDQGMEGEEQDDDNDVLGPSTSIYLDDTVEFVVERIHECGGLISLDGTHPSVSAM